MSQCKLPLLFSSLLAGFTTIGILLMTGCGIGEPATGVPEPAGAGTPLSGVIHGGLNPVIGATVTLYFTAGTGSGSTSAAYGTGATAVASTTTVSPGGTFTLGNPSGACPSGGYAYVGVYGGNTGGNTTNANSLLMVPVGACSTNYSSSSPYAYTGGSSLFINEITTALSAYALGNFMTLSNSGMTGVPPTCGTGVACQINIGAPLNNTATSATGSSSVSPQAAGLAHAFANALALMNISTGQPNGYMYSNGAGGVIPQAEIFALGNILQACVNSSGGAATSNSANDGSLCGKLFSFTATPTGVTVFGPVTLVPTNTLQAALNLAKLPIPGGQANQTTATWNSACTATGTSSTTSACLFGLATSNSAAYPNALSSAPPDWSLATVYTSGYGLNTTSTTPSCTTSPNCPGLTYPFYVALDYQDNVYVLNYDANSGSLPQAATTWTNIIGITNSGAPIFATPEDTSHKAISIIATDMAQHVIGPNAANTNPAPVLVYSATSGVVLATPSFTNVEPTAIAVDPFNNLYVASYVETVNFRKFGYSGTPTSPVYATAATYSAISLTTAGSPYQMVFDSNLDLYEFLNPAYGGTGSPYACLLTNQSSSTYTYMSAAPPTYTNCTTGGNTAVAVPGNTGSGVLAAGIGVTSSNGALVIGSNGITKITKTGTTSSATIAAGSTTAIPAVNTSLYSRYMSVDGNNWGYSADGANGQVSGVSVFDSTDSLALGTYKGCFVNAATTITCGTVNSAGATQAPMASPRATAIDSSGDIWVVSGNTSDLTELIGAAAPTWPGLSMAKSGLPQ